MRVYWWLLILSALGILALALLAGCGGATPGGLASTGDHSEPHIQGQAFPQPLAASAEAQAQELDYRGRRALQLSNGLVTVTALPAASGRIVSFSMGSFEYLRPDPALAQPATDKAAVDGGGDVVMAVSEKKPGETPALPAAWKGEVLTARGIYAEAKITSPEDKQSGVQIVRTLRLYANSTRLTVTDTLTNTAEKSGKWSLQTATQLTGLVGPGAPRGQVRLYAPLAPAQGHPEGFWSLAQDGDTSQFQAGAQGRLLEVTYNGKAGEVAVSPRAGWLAYTESGGNHALVRRFTVSATGEYPDSAPARLRTALAEQGVAYVEMLTVSPWQELKPGASLALAQDWYATVVPGPIVDTAEQAAVSAPLVLKAQGQGYQLTGRLGVFAPGTLLISPVDGAGQSLGDPIRVPVAPGEPVALDQAIAGHVGAASVQLALENQSGTPLATLASVPLPSPTG